MELLVTRGAVWPAYSRGRILYLPELVIYHGVVRELVLHKLLFDPW